MANEFDSMTVDDLQGQLVLLAAEVDKIKARRRRCALSLDAKLREKQNAAKLQRVADDTGLTLKVEGATGAATTVVPASGGVSG